MMLMTYFWNAKIELFRGSESEYQILLESDPRHRYNLESHLEFHYCRYHLSLPNQLFYGSLVGSNVYLEHPQRGNLLYPEYMKGYQRYGCVLLLNY